MERKWLIPRSFMEQKALGANQMGAVGTPMSRRGRDSPHVAPVFLNDGAGQVRLGAGVD